MLTYKIGWINRADRVSDIFTCLLSIGPGMSFGISRTILLIAWTDNYSSNKCNEKYNCNLFHIYSIILLYKNILFILKTIFMPKIIIKGTPWLVLQQFLINTPKSMVVGIKTEDKPEVWQPFLFLLTCDFVPVRWIRRTWNNNFHKTPHC